MSEPEKEPVQPVPKLTLDILTTISVAQAQHGMRYSDYQRKYLTARCHRIRRAMKFVTHPVRGAKQYAMKEITPEVATHSEFLTLLVSLTERSWAFAMQRKEEAEKRSIIAAKNHLRKAIKWSSQLYEICQEVADDRTTLESEAYLAWCRGNYSLEIENHEEALKDYGLAQTIYERLSEMSTVAQRRLCAQRIAEIMPNIRYCRYTLERDGVSRDSLLEMQAGIAGSGVASNLLKSKMDSLVQEWRSSHDVLSSITVRDGREIPLPSGPVREAFVTIQDTCYALEKDDKNLDLYTSIMNAHTNALTLLEKHKSDDTETLVEHVRSGLLRFSLIRFRVLSDDMMAKKMPAVDLVHLWERAGECIDGLIDLPSVQDGTNEHHLLKARKEGCLAQRCFHMASTYVEAKEWKNVSALLSRCGDRTSDAMTAMIDAEPFVGELAESNESDTSNFDRDTLEQLKEAASEYRALHALLNMVRAEKARLVAGQALQGHDVAQITEATANMSVSDKPGKLLLDRLNDYDEQSRDISIFPPPLTRVAVKPIVYDLAGASIHPPNLKQRIEKKGWLSSFWK